MLNNVQKAALELIRSDAQYIYTLVELMKSNSKIDSNYISMSLPYIGVFAHGSEQLVRKVGLNPPIFNQEEKAFYEQLRLSHKLFDKKYPELKKELLNNLRNSDNYYYANRNLIAKLLGYNNYGVDVIDNTECGNTILCAVYNPLMDFNKDCGHQIRKMSEVTGKLASFYYSDLAIPLTIDTRKIIYTRDYHFNKNTPLKDKSDDAFVLFSILCNINFCIYFMENTFIEDTCLKFKFAYLQYYYLCSLIPSMNEHTNYVLTIDENIKNTSLRNCIAHYGLGQVISEKELNNDPLKGITIKTLGLTYEDSKKQLFSILKDIERQITTIIY
ncbi:MAG: hypothetical protein ACRDCN_02600 [Tannerellaceae bacterium]